jgi:hypothetical protein
MWGTAPDYTVFPLSSAPYSERRNQTQSCCFENNLESLSLRVFEFIGPISKSQISRLKLCDADSRYPSIAKPAAQGAAFPCQLAAVLDAISFAREIADLFRPSTR